MRVGYTSCVGQVARERGERGKRKKRENEIDMWVHVIKGMGPALSQCN
jgi:hypothetical protein